MANQVSVKSIGEIHIPELKDSSDEESLFATPEDKTHLDHKKAEASQRALDLAKEEIRKLEIENDDLAMLGPHRRRYSWHIFWFVVFFVSATFAVLVGSSYQTGTTAKTVLVLDNEVLITLLATNAVQVVGLLYVVAKWLFPSRASKKSKSEDKTG